ncbi:MAG: T9SS type A sorting domain-containing protein [Flavobacteriales bacterium]|nr:T9SS type A sorting domain-containing protein [Flavobacteriales bacterium]MBP9081251.1 T9SS type A sorting domain-containing protein [Flavobacteriales bacterium]
MRSALLILILLAPLLAHGQYGWATTLEPSAEKLLVTDALETPTGDVRLSLTAYGSIFDPFTPTTRSWVVDLSSSGEIQGLAQVQAEPGRSVYVSDLKRLPGGELVMVSNSWLQSPISSFKILVHEVHAFDDLELSIAKDLGDSLRIWYTNSCQDQDGNLFILGSLIAGPGVLPNRLLLLRASPQDSILASSIQGYSTSMKIGRHAIPSRDSLMRVSMDGNLPGSPIGTESFHRFTPQLEHVDAFALTSLSGTGAVQPIDSLMKDCLYMTGLAGDTFLVSGRFGNLEPEKPMRAALVRMAPDGSYHGTFLPVSGYDDDYIAYRQGHDMTPDGKVVFAVLENFVTNPLEVQMGMAPSRIHLYRLDTLLNVECEYIVDGFADNAYYFLTRIKATSDGGVLLMGSRRDLNTMAMPRGWIKKLDAEQCNPVGVEDLQQLRTAEVYPNPGHEGFTLLLSGPVVPGAHLMLHDAMGHLVREAPLQHNTLQVDAGDLSTGLYVYRILGRDGTMLGSGRWIKQ